MKKESKIYCCYSSNLRTYLKELNFESEFKAINPVTGKLFWAYLKTDELCKALREWTLRGL